MKSTVKHLTVNAIGIALFVALSLCLRVPVFENYYLCLGYVVMTVYCYSISTISGTLVGTMGVVLYCLLISGLRGMPGWAAGNLLLGIIMGESFKLTKRIKNTAIEIAIESIIITIATAISILGVKSLVEHLIYGEFFLLRVAKNISAFIADAFMIIASIPICKLTLKRKI